MGVTLIIHKGVPLILRRGVPPYTWAFSLTIHKGVPLISVVLCIVCVLGIVSPERPSAAGV